MLSAKWNRDSGWKEDLAFHHCSETLLLKAMDSWHLVSTGILPGRITVVSTQHGKLGGNLSAITPDSLVLLLLECTCFNAKAGIQAVMQRQEYQRCSMLCIVNRLPDCWLCI